MRQIVFIPSQKLIERLRKRLRGYRRGDNKSPDVLNRDEALRNEQERGNLTRLKNYLQLNELKPPTQ